MNPVHSSTLAGATQEEMAEIQVQQGQDNVRGRGGRRARRALARAGFGNDRMTTRAQARGGGARVSDEMRREVEELLNRVDQEGDEELSGVAFRADETRSENGDRSCSMTDREFRQETARLLMGLRNREHLLRRRTDDQQLQINAIEDLCQQFRTWDARFQEREVHARQNTEDIIVLSRDLAACQNANKKIDTQYQALNRRTEVQFERINELSVGQNRISQRVSAVERRMDEARALPGGGNMREMTNANIRYELPTFSASSSERPMRFLQAFLQYLKAVGASPENFKFIIDQALKGTASEWWEHVGPSIQTLTVFQERFRERYWNRNQQANIRHELDYGKYSANGNRTRSEYVLRLFNDITMLPDALEEEFIIDRLARHFDDVVQQAVIVQNVRNIDGLIELLDRLDRAGSVNNTLGVRYEDPPANNSRQSNMNSPVILLNRNRGSRYNDTYQDRSGNQNRPTYSRSSSPYPNQGRQENRTENANPRTLENKAVRRPSINEIDIQNEDEGNEQELY